MVNISKQVRYGKTKISVIQVQIITSSHSSTIISGQEKNNIYKIIIIRKQYYPRKENTVYTIGKYIPTGVLENIFKHEL